MPPPIAVPCPGSRCNGQIVLAIAAGEHQSSVAARLECDEATVWRTCQRYCRGGQATLFTDGRRGNWVACSRSPRCSGPRSWNWPAWNRSPRGCTSRTGPARIWPVRRWPTRSSPRSARPRSAASCTTSICNPTGPVLEDGPAGRPVQGAGGASPLVLRECGPARRAGHLGGVRR